MSQMTSKIKGDCPDARDRFCARSTRVWGGASCPSFTRPSGPSSPAHHRAGASDRAWGRGHGRRDRVPPSPSDRTTAGDRRRDDREQRRADGACQPTPRSTHLSGDPRVRTWMSLSNKSTAADQTRAGTSGLLGIGAIAGVTGQGIGVAVIDSGIAPHAALTNKVVANVNFVTGDPSSRDAVRPRHARRRHHRRQRRSGRCR